MYETPSADAHQSFPPLGRRVKALMVWPPFAMSFWSFQDSMPIFGKRAMVPPLGLLTVAALCPKEWSLRLIDESVEELRDSDIAWADLVMVSGMAAQRAGMHRVLRRSRALGKRTIVGGPHASSQPEDLIDLADHVVVGEPDEVFQRIAKDLEDGSARSFYQIEEKPDVNATPVPRYDLLKSEAYVGLSLQFSRGCPFQCEFCDIITIYGRKPRTKSPDRLLAELDALLALGRGREIFLVDDNLIGNRKRALELLTALKAWQEGHGYPFRFLTEASINLAQCPDLLDAMVEANFTHVFIGIESPSTDSLAETKKTQNLREDLRESIAHIQSRGLWVMGGFILGFDSDPDDIFEQQVKFISDAAIPFATIGMLVAPPTTPLHARMVREGRLLKDVVPSDSYHRPNFRTKMPERTLLQGYRETLARLYDARAYYERGLRSLDAWQASPRQRPTVFAPGTPAVLLRSVWYQGIRSQYRSAYWMFVRQLLRRWGRDRVKLVQGLMILIAGHHFISYAREVVSRLDLEIADLEEQDRASRQVVNA